MCVCVCQCLLSFICSFCNKVSVFDAWNNVSGVTPASPSTKAHTTHTHADTLSLSPRLRAIPSVLIGSISVVVAKWVMMRRFNGWRCFAAAFFSSHSGTSAHFREIHGALTDPFSERRSVHTVGWTGKEDGDRPSVAASREHVARLCAGPYVALWDDSRPGRCERMGSG